jgi:hypothetical protein
MGTLPMNFSCHADAARRRLAWRVHLPRGFRNPGQRLYLVYMGSCMPVIGWVATGGDASAYQYLLSGVRAIPGAPQFADEISAQGFVDVGYERLSFRHRGDSHRAQTSNDRRLSRYRRRPPV